ncbi:MAG: alginate export family protein [Planctomycetaceae bacterium]|nr:alginate export family protein [Planctomycetaceae bacterium]
MQATSVTVVGWFYQTELFLRRRPLAVCIFALMVGWLLADATAQDGSQRISDQAAPVAELIQPIAQPPPTVEPGKKGEAAPGKAVAPKSIWDGIPVVQKPAKPGNYGVAPTGPGYYSLRDRLLGECRETPPPTPYPPFGLMPPSFFDVNWSFLDDPKKSWSWSDGLKRQQLGCNWLATTGGSVWLRHMSERSARLSGVNQNYELLRTRAYLDLAYLDRARVYFEFIDAQRFGSTGILTQNPIDENHSDILNMFVDYQFMTVNDREWWARIGRQELTFGSQRLVSALEWANTRRTFEGVRMFRRTKESDLDVFWTQPVVVDDVRMDRVDGNQHFGGAWLTRRPTENRTVDHYYLFLTNSAPGNQFGLGTLAYDVHTFGIRVNGNEGQFHYDYEGMLQLGGFGTEDLLAGSATIGHGYHLKDKPWNPMLWLYYDWASGDNTPMTGSRNTFHQLFPFGHYYMGFGDFVGRQNIHDLNLHLVAYPRKWITFNTQYHYLTLASARDALYNPAGRVSRSDISGTAGRNVGHELDFLWNFHLNANSDVLVGYSRLFAGSYVQLTGSGADADLFYLQYGYRW